MSKMKHVFCAALLMPISLTVFLSEAAPLHRWTFDSREGDGRYSDSGTAAKRLALRARDVRKNVGAGRTSAAWIGKDALCYVPELSLEHDTVAIDMKFRLDGEPAAKGNTLFDYNWQSWLVGYVRAKVLPDNRIEVVFGRTPGKSSTLSSVKFKVVSDSFDLRPGAWHSLRMVAGGDGRIVLYVDGLKVLAKAGCPGFKGVKADESAEKPVLWIGVDNTCPDTPGHWLNGMVDDIAVYGEDPGEPTEAAEDDDGVLVLRKGGVAQTGKFIVQDRRGTGLNGIPLGMTEPPEEKFVAAASTVRFSVDKTTVSIECDCPVPPDMKAVKDANSVWKGDVIEAFIQPDPNRSLCYQYAVNAAGLTFAAKYVDGAGVSGWTSAFESFVQDASGGFRVVMKVPRSEMEVFSGTLSNGTLVKAQFTRCGPTSGGDSSWRPMGQESRDLTTFGSVILGSSKAYFRRKLEESRKTAESKFPSGEQRHEAEAVLTALSAKIEKSGDETKSFAILNAGFRELEQKFLAISLSGRNFLVYEPSDPWSNQIEPGPSSSPLESVELRVLPGTRSYHPIALANLGDSRYLGQVKFFDKYETNRFSLDGGYWLTNKADLIARRFKVHESVAAFSETGQDLLDAVSPLSMGTLLRLAPHSNTLLWLELDARGLLPGTYRSSLVFKRAAPGFETVTLPVKVTVKGPDVSTVRADRYIETEMPQFPQHPAFTRFLVDRGFNLVFCGTPGTRRLPMWNGYDKSGNLVPGNLAPLDKMLDAHIAAGIDRRRMGVVMYLALENPGFGPANAGERFGPRWNAALKAFLAQIHAHLESKYGIPYERLIFYPVDEPHGDIRDPKTKSWCCYESARLIKSFDSRYVLMVPTLVSTMPKEQWCENMTRYSEFIDIVQLFRMGLAPDRVEFARKLPFKSIWTYSIIGKDTPPAVYRRDFWEDARDGFSEVASYWHLDDMAGRDGFDSTDTFGFSGTRADYGSVYADFDNGQYLVSRRQIAADAGFDDIRLILHCRELAKGDAAAVQRVESIIRRAADRGTMKAMERARFELVEFADGRRGRASDK